MVDSKLQPTKPFVVMRRDDNNNEFEMSRHADYNTAAAEADKWTQRGHKQDYWVEDARDSSH